MLLSYAGRYNGQDFLSTDSRNGSQIGLDMIFYLFIFGFFETGFPYVALVPVLELALVDQADLKLTVIHLPLTPEHWD